MSSFSVRRSPAPVTAPSGRSAGSAPAEKPTPAAPADGSALSKPVANPDLFLEGSDALAEHGFTPELSHTSPDGRFTAGIKASWGKDLANPSVDLGTSGNLPVREGMEFGIKAGVQLGGEAIDSFGFQEARFGVNLSGRDASLSTDLQLSREGQLSGTATASGKVPLGEEGEGGAIEGKVDATFGPGMALEQVQGKLTADVQVGAHGQASAALEGQLGADGRFQSGSIELQASSKPDEGTAANAQVSLQLGEGGKVQQVQGGLSASGTVGEHGHASASLEGTVAEGRVQGGRLTVEGSHQPAENQGVSGSAGLTLGEDARFERLELQGHAQLSDEAKLEGAFNIDREGAGSAGLGLSSGEGNKFGVGVTFGQGGEGLGQLAVEGQVTRGGVTLAADAAVDGTFKLQSAGADLTATVGEGTTLGTSVRLGEEGLDSVNLTTSHQHHHLQLDASVGFKPNDGGLGANLGLNYKPNDNLSLNLEGSLEKDVAKARMGLAWRF